MARAQALSELRSRDAEASGNSFPASVGTTSHDIQLQDLAPAQNPTLVAAPTTSSVSDTTSSQHPNYLTVDFINSHPIYFLEGNLGDHQNASDESSSATRTTPSVSDTASSQDPGHFTLDFGNPYQIPFIGGYPRSEVDIGDPQNASDESDSAVNAPSNTIGFPFIDHSIFEPSADRTAELKPWRAPSSWSAVAATNGPTRSSTSGLSSCLRPRASRWEFMPRSFVCKINCVCLFPGLCYASQLHLKVKNTIC